MNCEEAKINLHHFLDNELDSKTKKEVEAHLHSCESCYKEFMKLRKFFDRLKILPYAVDPPQDIIESLSKELLARSASEAKKVTPEQSPNVKVKKGKITQEKKLKAERSAVRKSAVSRTILGYGLLKPYPTSKFEWKEIVIIPIILILFAVFYLYYDFQKYNSPWNIQCLDGYMIIN
ncbi:MAG: zf-HC2 domain-containing protein, partial [Bacteroidetes bacterium]|nr:zf-HC2 domain-containing protein [Bacteroidota bacterium]